MHIRFLISLVIILLSCTACKSQNIERSYPKSEEEVREERYGNLTGEGGLTLFGSKKRSDSTNSITVNGYLWRAALEVISFMPLTSTDPMGGVIITDWYVDQKAPNERFKLTVLITSASLRTDAIKVNVFRQVNSGNGWHDATADKSMSTNLEDRIIAQARTLRAAHKY